MIKIPHPAVALNAEDVPGPDYHMWFTWKISKNECPSLVLKETANWARRADGGKLKALVINCHGSPGKMYLGAGISWGEVGLFSSLSGLVDEIFVVACEVVSFTGPRDGNLLCGAIAKSAQARVFASNHVQSTGLWPYIPKGYIDGYEGHVWKWHPDGSNELTSF